MDDHPFTPELATGLGAVTTVHSWVFTGAAARLGADHADLARFGRYLVELAQAWSPDPQRPVWVQEIGAPTPSISPDQAPDFVRRTIGELVSSPAVQAITWWCSHDVSRSLADFPELEHTLGLIDEHGQAKPIGHTLAELIAQTKDATSATPDERTALLIPALEADRRSLTSPAGEVFSTWLAQPSQTALIGADQADPDTLAARGITTVIDPLGLMSRHPLQSQTSLPATSNLHTTLLNR